MAEDSSVWPGGQKLNPDGCVVSVFKCVSHMWDTVNGTSGRPACKFRWVNPMNQFRDIKNITGSMKMIIRIRANST